MWRSAGVRLIESVSGVAMGLLARGQEARVLTDIMDMENFLGDMDFRVAATRSGVCAIQADVKISGIDYNYIKQAVEGGMEVNHRILDIMDKCLDRQVESKPCWPVSKIISIPAVVDPTTNTLTSHGPLAGAKAGGHSQAKQAGIEYNGIRCYLSGKLK